MNDRQTKPLMKIIEEPILEEAKVKSDSRSKEFLGCVVAKDNASFVPLASWLASCCCSGPKDATRIAIRPFTPSSMLLATAF